MGVTIENKEVELQREMKLVARANQPLPSDMVKRTLKVLNRLGQEHLRLRPTPIRGTGYVRDNYLEINLTVPLDVRYEKHNQENADAFNMGWATELRDKYGVQSGGYVSLDASF